jgi:hypothetical protein
MHDETRADSELSAASIAELEQMITETREMLESIKGELEYRKQRQQHIEIDRLEAHLADARPKWSEVRNFFDLVLKELRK